MLPIAPRPQDTVEAHVSLTAWRVSGMGAAPRVGVEGRRAVLGRGIGALLADRGPRSALARGPGGPRPRGAPRPRSSRPPRPKFPPRALPRWRPPRPSKPRGPSAAGGACPEAAWGAEAASPCCSMLHTSAHPSTLCCRVRLCKINAIGPIRAINHIDRAVPCHSVDWMLRLCQGRNL